MADETFEVVREIDIAGSPQAVYAEVEDFHRWEAWSPWADLDPSMQTTYSGPDSGVGATYAWTGNRKVGSGSMEVLEAVPAEHVLVDLKFLKPFKAHNNVLVSFEPQGDSTHVVWRMTGPVTTMTKVMGLFTSMDKMVGKDFEKGLSQLKAVVEAS